MQKLFLTSLITLGIISSFVFFIVILVLMLTDSVSLPLAIMLTVIINVILFFLSPVIADFINRFIYKVRFVSTDELKTSYTAVYEIIATVVKDEGFKFPKVGIIPDNNPTAFTYGSGRDSSRIIITEGILKFLSPEEVKAVVAHELGHVAHRDFLVMMVASTLIQVLYEIYAWLRHARGKQSGGLRMVALVSYVFYLISTYLLLFLSRTREYLADAFSAKYVVPQHLANALIKIAYGIVSVEDSESTTRLLMSTRHLGILDVQNAKHIGVISYVTNNDPNKLAEVMVFDRVSPWAKLIELNSTHPLTGNRVAALAALSTGSNQPFAYDVDAAIGRMSISHDRLYAGFFLGIAIHFAPLVFALLSLAILPFPLAITAAATGLLVQVFYKFPTGEKVPSTILELMRDPYLSPVRGRPVSLTGSIIGRGIPGYVFSEDVMLQDPTGMTFLDYNSAWGFLGDMFFAIGKVKKLIGSSVTAQGWVFRTMSSMVSLSSLKTADAVITSHPILWQLVMATIMGVVGVVLWIIMGAPMLPFWMYAVAGV